ncbi:flagellar assembly protein FliH [Salsuginibacillus halophilus]|uniref:Flagellar assembly protein FliH n=1 Tax=Salsuginibacillus halophilus TaxID=517424 RepID=A0A2P8HYA7_9BACI|nr:flagellar assembly protein FliH [Salsuginibacillus halophilus]PSL51189.1 flagellar assembly protein FliH [Salsuginibacillus halophilus]
MSNLIKAGLTKPAKKGEVEIGIRAFPKAEPAHEEAPAETVEEDEAAVQEEVNETSAEELLEQAKHEAEKIKQKAEEEAENVRKQAAMEEENAKQQLNELFEQAKENGYAEGYEEGQKAGEKAFKKKVKKAEETIKTAESERKQYLEESEPVIIELASAVANRVIKDGLQADETVWQQALAQALFEVQEQEEVKVYVSAERYNETVKHKDELVSLLSYSQELFIYPDANLNENDCIIETPFGRMDASIDNQLEELKTKLLERLKEDADARS